MTNLLNTQNITSEFTNPKGLVLVYPKDLPDNRSELINFYNDFIKTVLGTKILSELTLVVRPTARLELENFLNELNTETKINVLESKTVQDVWVRDFCPIYFKNNSVVKALYNPSYFSSQHIKYADIDDKVGIEIATYLKLHLNYFVKNDKTNLILDGGNLIHNGNGVGVVSNRVISDNEDVFIDGLKEIFKSKLNISDLIIVPVEPGDKTGHVDGMMRFINEKTVLVASYPNQYSDNHDYISEKDYRTGKDFLNTIADYMTQKSLNVIRIDHSILLKTGKFPSAFGNYINYLRIGGTVFLPQYNIPQDKNAVDLFKMKFPSLNTVSITTDIEKLAKHGGVLNCISWQYY